VGCFVDGWVWTVVVEEDAWEGVLWARAGANLHSDGFDVYITWSKMIRSKRLTLHMFYDAVLCVMTCYGRSE